MRCCGVTGVSAGQSRCLAWLLRPCTGHHGNGPDAEDCESVQGAVVPRARCNRRAGRRTFTRLSTGSSTSRPMRVAPSCIRTKDRRQRSALPSIGMEFIDQTAAGVTLDAVIVAAGGGGLTGGVACAVKQMSPSTAVYVVEPEGADSMNRSFKAGSPQAIEAVRTIADSLGAPRCEPYSFSPEPTVRRRGRAGRRRPDPRGDAVDIPRRKLAVEPAGAAALAALMYPLRSVSTVSGRLGGVRCEHRSRDVHPTDRSRRRLGYEISDRCRIFRDSPHTLHDSMAHESTFPMDGSRWFDALRTGVLDSPSNNAWPSWPSTSSPTSDGRPRRHST